MFTHWLKSAINERDNDGCACENSGDLAQSVVKDIPDPRNSHMYHLGIQPLGDGQFFLCSFRCAHWPRQIAPEGKQNEDEEKQIRHERPDALKLSQNSRKPGQDRETADAHTHQHTYCAGDEALWHEFGYKSDG